MAATRSSGSNPRLSTSSIPSVKPSSSLTESPADTSTLLNRRTDDVFQSIIKGRKSWKTARGGEIVWPPELESALIEGLENYQPDDSRETRLLGRFPMRNRFISDWIYEKTGKRRTAKQVGSRLQQLRDTCGGKRCKSPNATVRLHDVRANSTCPIVLKLLTPNRPVARPASLSLSPELQDVAGPSNFRGPPPLRHDTESGSDTSPPNSPTTPTDAHATLQSLLYRGVESRSTELPNSIVFIDLIPHPSAGPSSSHSGEEHLWKGRGFQISRASPFPRHLRDIDSTITLLSKSTTSARSFFTVYSGEDVVFSEVTSLKPLGPPPGDFDFDNSSSCLYSTSLVPGFWCSLVQSPDPTQYTIVQRVVQDSSALSPPCTLFSATYKFTYASCPYISAPSAAVVQTALQKDPTVEFSFDSLLAMDPDGFTNMPFDSKTHGYYDLSDTYVEGGWSSGSSSAQTSTYHPSPIQYDQGHSEFGSDDSVISPISPTSTTFSGDVFNYVSSFWLNLKQLR
ncbi:hypothetical protein K443DRAFT_90627 [Laccaria amethystina LaAM-08-1]|uniref:TEA domain-containing protein n=1 Tax=Laccaria amethystina LaAM-08-1 TaxID=1095629 RepID=A0A0C9XW46_9AGAR|nr:hypothetical protein K443DRAFT_90627 [Laccaria amethystina LaAM-08-1]